MSKHVITAHTIEEEVKQALAEEEIGGSAGAWDQFTLVTLPHLCTDLDVTMQYFRSISKEQFDYVCDMADEIVYKLQSTELCELIESLYHKFYGNDLDTEMYRQNISNLKHVLRKNGSRPLSQSAASALNSSKRKENKR